MIRSSKTRHAIMYIETHSIKINSSQIGIIEGHMKPSRNNVIDHITGVTQKYKLKPCLLCIAVAARSFNHGPVQRNVEEL